MSGTDANKGSKRTARARVLIADDDKHLLTALSRGLQAMGYQCVTAADGDLALAELRRQDCDVTLLDLDMPGIDGFGLIEIIRKQDLNTIPIVLTGTGNVHDAVKAMKLGVFDFLEKPCNPELVEQVLQRALANREAVQTSKRMTELADQWEATFNASRDPMVAVGLDGRIIRCNRAAANHGRADLVTLPGRDCHEALCNDSHGANTCPFQWATGNINTGLTEVEIWGGVFEFACADLCDKTAEPWGRLFTARDITERMRTARALRESEQKFRVMTSTAQDAILMMDGAGNITFYNAAAESIFGWTAEEVLGENLHVVLTPEGARMAHEAGMEQFWQSGSGPAVGKTRELVARRKDGTEIPVEISLSGVHLGGTWHALGILRDISERKGAEETLRASEEKFRQIVDNIGLGVALVNPDMQVLELNRQMREWFPGIDLQSAPVCHRVFNHPPSQDICPYCPTIKTMREGNVYEATTSTPHPDGVRNFRIVASPIHDAEGRVVAAIEIVEDITEKLRLEQELSQAQKLEAVGRLAAGIAHEINTPTQYVGDNIEFLQIAFENLLAPLDMLRSRSASDTEPADSSIRLAEIHDALAAANIDYLLAQIPRAMEQSAEGVGRVASIVSAMKEFSHPGTTEKTLVSLNQCIQSTVVVSRNEWKYVANLITNFDESLPQVLCLPNEINQVVLNLIVNAAHAISDRLKSGDAPEEKGTITISTRQDGEWAEVRVSDTGTGVPSDVREHIFDPFFTTKEVGRGTGQGLSIARNVVVDKHGGTISLESAPGEGATFIVRLPLNPGHTGKRAGDMRPEEATP